MATEKKPRRFLGAKKADYLKQKEARKRRERLKKFPSIAISGRPIPTNRSGGVTPKEVKIISLMLEDQPQDISAEQVDQMAKLLRRNPETIKSLILKARDRFTDNAKVYIEVHAKSVQSAYANGQFDTAATHAEWAMENISSEGVSIIDAASKKGTNEGPRVVIGVNLGGVTPVNQ